MPRRRLRPPDFILISLCVAQAGLNSSVPLLLTIPSTILPGQHAAGGIAAVNSVGLLGGFVGPYVMGMLTMGSGGYQIGLLVFGAAAIFGGLLAMTLKLSPVQAAAAN